MSTIAVKLSDEESERIAAIAEARSETPACVVREAVTAYLDYDAEFRAAVQQGLDEADRDEGVDFDIFAADVRALSAARLAASKA